MGSWNTSFMTESFRDRREYTIEIKKNEIISYSLYNYLIIIAISLLNIDHEKVVDLQI